MIIPTKECAATIAGVLEETVGPLAELGLVDDVSWCRCGVDGRNGRYRRRCRRTRAPAGRGDAEHGPALGKGDAMWRALQVTPAETRLLPRRRHGRSLTPTISRACSGRCSTDVSCWSRASFERPLTQRGHSLPHEGGRVTELMARPLINLHEPLLAGFAQPLAGEFAARRSLLESVCRSRSATESRSP